MASRRSTNIPYRKGKKQRKDGTEKRANHETVEIQKERERERKKYEGSVISVSLIGAYCLFGVRVRIGKHHM